MKLEFWFEKNVSRKSAITRISYFLVVWILLFFLTPTIKLIFFANYIFVLINRKRNFLLYKILKTYTTFCYIFDNYVSYNSNIVPRISLIKQIWNNIN